MATDFIVINRSDANAIFAGNLIALIRSADTLYSQLENITNKMQEMVDGEDYSQIELLFGLPEGKGQAMKTVLDNLLTTLAVEDDPFDLLRSRLG